MRSSDSTSKPPRLDQYLKLLFSTVLIKVYSSHYSVQLLRFLVFLQSQIRSFFWSSWLASCPVLHSIRLIDFLFWLKKIHLVNLGNTITYDFRNWYNIQKTKHSTRLMRQKTFPLQIKHVQYLLTFTNQACVVFFYAIFPFLRVSSSFWPSIWVLLWWQRLPLTRSL